MIPIPYDFDFSGLVDAPYATPPDVLKIANVRQRFYRGYCATTTHALAAARQMRAARAADARAPSPRSRASTPAPRRAQPPSSSGFFADIATDASSAAKSSSAAYG